MFDGTYSRSKRGHNSRFAVAMSRNDSVRACRFFDNCAHLFITELLMDGVIQLAHHAARRTNFNEPGAEAKLAADLIQTRGHAVAQGKDR